MNFAQCHEISWFFFDGIPKVDRLLTGLTAQPKGTTARWFSNKTSLSTNVLCVVFANGSCPSECRWMLKKSTGTLTSLFPTKRMT